VGAVEVGDEPIALGAQLAQLAVGVLGSFDRRQVDRGDVAPVIEKLVEPALFRFGVVAIDQLVERAIEQVCEAEALAVRSP
jgi:hypothetical protein